MTGIPPAPGMPIECSIDGQTFQLRFPLRVMKRLDHEHGISLMRGGENIGQAFQDPEKLAILLHAGISTNHPDVTLEWIEDHVEASMLLDLMPLLVYAASGRWIDRSDERPASPNGARPEATGSSFGPLDGTTSVLTNGSSGN